MVPGSTTLELLEASRGFFPKVLKPDWRLNLRSFRLARPGRGCRALQPAQKHRSPSSNKSPRSRVPCSFGWNVLAWLATRSRLKPPHPPCRRRWSCRDGDTQRAKHSTAIDAANARTVFAYGLEMQTPSSSIESISSPDVRALRLPRFVPSGILRGPPFQCGSSSVMVESSRCGSFLSRRAYL